MPVWTVLDMTPGGRSTDWYPKLEYGPAPKEGLHNVIYSGALAS